MALRLTLLSHPITPSQRHGCFPIDEAPDRDWQEKPSPFRKVTSNVRFLCGPEQRVVQTAALYSSKAETVLALKDCDFGRWTGRRISELAQQEPEMVASWFRDWEVSPHGGESIQQLHKRVSEWMTALDDFGHVIAVTHPFVMRAALMYALNCPATAFHAIDIDPLSTIELRRNGLTWRMRTLQVGI